MMNITRPTNDNYNIIYLDKAIRLAKRLRIIPSVLLVGISGSLASGRANEKSDIDFFIVSRAGRIFTTRFFCKLILGHRVRRNRDKNPAGKICLNYFLSENSLDFKPHNNYVAQGYKNAIILFARGDIVEQLIRANKWMTPKFNFTNLISHPERSAYRRRVEGSFQLVEEFGNLLEIGLKSLQIWKIKKDPKTQKYPNKIIFSDTELRFHPPRGED